MGHGVGLLVTRRGAIGGIGGAFACAAACAASPAMAMGEARRFPILAGDGRKVEIHEWRPRGTPVGTILFSHGAGSSPRFYDVLLGPMIAAGWHVLAPLHVDSREHPDTASYPGLASWRARLEDFQALTAHIGHRRFMAVGHSYGALTALVLGGAQSVAPAGWQGPQTDGKAMAVIAFSPPPAIPGLITKEGYAQLSVPALIQTGSADVLPQKTGTDPLSWHRHLDAYDAAAAGHDRYGLVLAGVSHYFGGLICDFNQPGPPAVQGVKDAVRIAGLFLAAYGRGHTSAKKQLLAALSEDLPVRLTVK